jgi:hypothetical protein
MKRLSRHAHSPIQPQRTSSRKQMKMKSRRTRHSVSQKKGLRVSLHKVAGIRGSIPGWGFYTRRDAHTDSGTKQIGTCARKGPYPKQSIALAWHLYDLVPQIASLHHIFQPKFCEHFLLHHPE